MNGTTILHTEKLRTGYGQQAISDDLNLSLNRGQLVCLIGPNGAGKSTLVRSIGGLQAPLSGVSYLCGDDVTTLSPLELARRLSIVLTERPDVGLLNGYAVVALGRHPYTGWMGRLSQYDSAMVHWAVAAVGAADIAHKPVIEMSDGQRQKIMIARALAQDPALMILDEPTAYLDLPRRAEIMGVLAHLAHTVGNAILVTTHDLDLALRTADVIWLMTADGRVRTGTPEDLVLSGAFEDAFRSEGVCFDPLTGTFHTGAIPSDSVLLVGDGLGYVWTRRALERKGWRVEANGAPTRARIDVHGQGDDLCWTIQHAQTVRTVESVGDLVAALDAIDGG